MYLSSSKANERALKKRARAPPLRTCLPRFVSFIFPTPYMLHLRHTQVYVFANQIATSFVKKENENKGKTDEEEEENKKCFITCVLFAHPFEE
jgi:hypothetical protein